MDTTPHDLKILSICHYILGGIHAAMCLVFVAYAVFLGALFASLPQGNGGGIGPAEARIMVVVFSVFAVLGVAYSACILLGGRFLSQRRHYNFCFALGVLNCIGVPFGTVLAIFTFIVLTRPSTRKLFDASGPIQLPPPIPDWPMPVHDAQG